MGSDCKCKCFVPVPPNCMSGVSSKKSESKLRNQTRSGEKKIKINEAASHLAVVQLGQIQSSITQLISALDKLERALNHPLLKKNLQRTDTKKIDAHETSESSGLAHNISQNIQTEPSLAENQLPNYTASVVEATVSKQPITEATVTDFQAAVAGHNPLVQNITEAYNLTFTSITHGVDAIVRPKILPVHQSLIPDKKENHSSRLHKTDSATTFGNVINTKNVSTAIQYLLESRPTKPDLFLTPTVETIQFSETTATTKSLSTTRPSEVNIKPNKTQLPQRHNNFEPYRNVQQEKQPTPKDYYDDQYYYDYDSGESVHSGKGASDAHTRSDNRYRLTSSHPTENPTQISKLTETAKQIGVSNEERVMRNRHDYDNAFDGDDDYYAEYEYLASTTQTTAPMKSAESCGTLLNLSEPQVIQDFGRREGAWLRDPEAVPSKRGRIYVTNFYYGSNLIEFENVENFRNFRWSNSYMLPYNWIGTGHMVYNGSFYYNRAFSTNLIKYDLAYRFVSAWGHLRNAVYDSSTPFTWRGHTNVNMAADGQGLWVMYPTYNDFDSSSTEYAYVLNKLNAIDLRVISSWKTPFLRQSVSHLFMICGVVYATNRFNERNTRITQAYDTYTGVQRTLFVPFVNQFSYNVQLLYYHQERKLLSWDNGHQIEYMVHLAH
ncbi:uncharacterized protein LOC143450787 isoform X2 [Clavelina lepadiformis]